MRLDYYVDHVTFNGKGGVDMPLGLRTAIIGPNKSGKTSAITALTLALAGYADVGGKRMKGGGDLMALLPKRYGRLEAVARWTVGPAATLTTEGEDGRGKRPQPGGTQPHDPFPLDDLVEALKGNTNTIRTYLVQRVQRSSTIEDVRALLPQTMADHWDDLADLVGDRDRTNGATFLAALEKRVGEELRAARASVSTAQADVDSGVAAAPEATAVAAAATAVDDTRAAVQAARRADPDVGVIDDATLQRRRQEALALKRQIEAAPEVAPGLTDRERVLLGRKDDIHKDVAALRHMVERTRSTDSQRCPFCAEDHSGADTDLTARMEALEGKIAQLMDALNSAATRKAEVRVETKADLQAKLNQLIARVKANKAYSALVRAHREAEGTRAQLDQQAKAAERYQGARERLAVAEASVQRYEAAQTWIKRARNDLVEKGRKALVARVNQHLKGETFDLHLQEGDRDVALFGFVRDGVLHTGLSGAERAKMLAALTAAVIDPKADYACVVLDEVGQLDNDELLVFMRGMAKARCQVVLTHPAVPGWRIPGDKVPEGWSVVYTDGLTDEQADVLRGQVPMATATSAAASTAPAPKPVTTEDDLWDWDDDGGASGAPEPSLGMPSGQDANGDWIRIPAGHPDAGLINNCALVNGADEEECQVCGGCCPDRNLLEAQGRVLPEGEAPSAPFDPPTYVRPPMTSVQLAPHVQSMRHGRYQQVAFAVIEATADAPISLEDAIGIGKRCEAYKKPRREHMESAMERAYDSGALAVYPGGYVGRPMQTESPEGTTSAPDTGLGDTPQDDTDLGEAPKLPDDIDTRVGEDIPLDLFD